MGESHTRLHLRRQQEARTPSHCCSRSFARRTGCLPFLPSATRVEVGREDDAIMSFVLITLAPLALPRVDHTSIDEASWRLRDAGS